ncbi:hypothetical protein ACOME3_008353 [Neoechinorhynchus agilis]
MTQMINHGCIFMYDSKAPVLQCNPICTRRIASPKVPTIDQQTHYPRTNFCHWRAQHRNPFIKSSDWSEDKNFILHFVCTLSQTKVFECESKTKLVKFSLSLSSTRVAELDLSHNQIKSLPVRSLVNASKLRKLDLSYNLIRKLPSFSFGYVQSLTYLDLSHNELRFIDSHAFERHPDSYVGAAILETLDISYNRLTALPPFVFAYLTNLRFLHLHSNQLNDLCNGSIWSGLVKLVYLDLDHNNISELDFDSSRDLYNLRNLTINVNQLRELHPCHFHNLKSLESLQLMSNNVSELNDCVFHRSSPFIRSVKLGDNPLRHLRTCTFFQLKEAYSVDLSNSQLKCNCDYFRLTHFHPFKVRFTGSACQSYNFSQQEQKRRKQDPIVPLCATEHSIYMEHCRSINCDHICNSYEDAKYNRTNVSVVSYAGANFRSSLLTMASVAITLSAAG